MFHIGFKLDERTRVVIMNNLSFAEWVTMFRGAKTTTLLDHLTHHGHIPNTAMAAGIQEFKCPDRFGDSHQTNEKKETGSPLDLSTID